MTTRVRAVFLAVAVGAAAAGLSWAALAQTPCVDGANPGACSVGPGVAFPGTSISTSSDGATVNNQGSVTGPVDTFSDNSGVGNSGTLDGSVSTAGANSGVTNSGTLTGDVLTSGPGSAVGNSGTIGGAVTTFGDRSGVSNTGSIGIISTFGAFSGVSNSGYVAFGIGTSGDSSAISNSGTVDGTVATVGVNAGITNSGFIAWGVSTNGDNSGVVNSGTVNVGIATLGNNSGVRNLGSIFGDVITLGEGSGLTNSGTINGQVAIAGPNSPSTNSGTISGDFYSQSNLTNSGRINGAIILDNPEATLSLLPGSVIVGDVIMPTPGARTLAVGNGLNVLLNFCGCGAPEIVKTGGAPYVVVGNQVAVLDPTLIARQNEMLVDLTGAIANSVFGRIGSIGGGASNAAFGGGVQLGANGLMNLGFGVGAGSGESGPPRPRGRAGAWAQAFGVERTSESAGAATQSDASIRGGMGGIDAVVMPGIWVGGFGGGSSASAGTQFGSHALDVESTFGGVYARVERLGFVASFSVTAGVSDTDSSRTIANNFAPNGIERAHAAYKGRFIAPEAQIATAFSLAGLMLEPSVRVRYASMSLDGYAERGASDTLTMAERDVSVWLGRFQLAAPFAGPAVVLAPRFGVETWSSSDDLVHASLLGQPIAFDPGGRKTETTGFFGVSFAPKFGGGVSAFLDGEVHVTGAGIARSEARGGLAVRF